MKPIARPGAPMALLIGSGPLGVLALAWLHAGGVLHLPPLNPSVGGAFVMLCVAPLVEEFAFRGALMDGFAALQRRLRLAPAHLVSWPNLASGVVFAACHLPYQPAPLACAMLLPSLLLGHVREATGSIRTCVLLHAWFNACFLLWFAR